jgi:adenine phosphoribosyltransferase
MVTIKTPADLLASVRTVPDFPKQGIMFRDITTLLKDPGSFSAAVDFLYDHYRASRIGKVVGVESRGFILGAALAYRLGAGFVPARKPGKLPAPATRESYALEYGTDAVEIHNDALLPGDRVLMHDDLLATGGTMCAAAHLVERLGGSIVGYSFLIELSFLQGRARLASSDVFSLLTYDRE